MPYLFRHPKAGIYKNTNNSIASEELFVFLYLGHTEQDLSLVVSIVV